MRKVRLAVFGYGNRAKKYLTYLESHPGEIELAGIVDIDKGRLEEARQKYPSCGQIFYSSSDDFFSSADNVDAVIIGTPDDTHYGLCMKALEHGCHVLLEKPAAQTMSQCRDIMAESARQKAHVILCYVLRYHPLYACLKEILASGKYGDIVSINHIVNVGIDRTCHTFVRGPWGDSKTTNPMIVSKCCHDLDLIVWLTGQKAKRVSSFGSLKWFRAENAPQGSTERCIDCPLESRCPYSAVDLYDVRRDWISNFDVPEGSSLDEVIRRELREGPYGRCVFRCDNNVVDHQIVSMEMENDVTISFAMDSFTLGDQRETHIRLTHGEIDGDERTLRVKSFRGRKERVYDFSPILGTPFHAGADLNLIEDFVEALAHPGERLRTAIDHSVESHRICFEAERSRLTGQTITLERDEYGLKC